MSSVVVLPGGSWASASNQPYAFPAIFVGGNGAGALTINNGGTVSVLTSAIQIGANAGSNGTLTLGNGGPGTASLSSNNDPFFSVLNVGSLGTGTVNVNANSTISGFADTLLGVNAGGSGTMTVNGGTTSTTSMSVGQSGAGTLTVQNGGAVISTKAINVGQNAGATGTINIGAASGQSPVAPGTISAPAIQFGSGAGTLVFNHTSAGYTFGTPIQGGGSVAVESGTTILTGVNTYTGGTTVSGGTLQVGVAAVGMPGAVTSSAIGTGTLTLGGGTLQAGGNYTVANAVQINATGGTIDANGQTFRLSGNISDGSGPGSLLVTGSGGAGTVILSGTNTYSGATTIAGPATLQLGSASALPTTAALTVNGTLALNGFSATVRSLSGNGFVFNSSGGPATLTVAPASGSITTFFGSITNTAGNDLTLVKNGAGALNLSGTNSYTGGTQLNAGRLAIVNDAALGLGPLYLNGGTLVGGSLGFVNGAVGVNATCGTLQADVNFTIANAVQINATGGTIDTQGNSLTLSGVISGTGGLTKIGSGTLDLTGTNTYTGATTVSAGTLLVDGSIASSTVTVAPGATLGGQGTIGGFVVQSGATLAPGVVTPFTTLNVSGNVTFASGSTFLVNVNPAGQSDKLVAGGTVTLQGGTVQVLAGSGTYLPTMRYTLLTAGGGVSGTFASLATSANLAQAFAFLSPSLSYDANDVYLGFRQTVPFASVAITRNQAATATAVQALGLGNPVFNAVLNQSVTGARQAFDALSGEVHASAVTAALEDQRLPREAILDRLSQAAEQPALGASTTMTGAYAADLPTRKGPQLAPVEVQMATPRLFGLWGQGFGNWGTTNGDHNAAKLTRDTGGFIIGADTTQALGGIGVWRLGVAGGYTQDSLKVSGRASSGDYQSVFGAVYGGTNFGAIDLKLGMIAGSSDTTTNRSIVFPLFADTAHASYGGYAVQGFGELGYHLPFHESLWSYVPGLERLHVNYEPVLQASLIHLGQDGYRETGFAGAGLIGSSQDYDLGSTTLGLRSEYSLASLPGLTLRSFLGWRYAFGDVKPKVTQAFASSLGSFSVAGVPIDRNALVSEAQLDYAISSSVSAGLSYSGQYGQRAQDQAVKAHLDVSF